MKAIRCILKPEKEKPLEGFHPWVFSGAIDQIEDDYKVGDLVKVFSSQGRFLGTGYLNPRSQIAIRMLTFTEERVDEDFFRKRIQNALGLRTSYISGDTTAYRLIHSEGDFLPGLIVDRYSEYLVMQVSTAGMEQWKHLFVDILQKQTGVRSIFEKNDSDWREWEGLEKITGKLAGEEPPSFVEIKENGLNFVVNVQEGQKTGFFLDQRDNRALIGRLAKGKRVLNCFAYTGGFSVYAAKGGAAETVSVEVSDEALNTARVNFERNQIPLDHHQFVCEDVFDYLRSSRQEFDLIILDPPAFCKSKQQIMQATRGYKDINLFAMKRLTPGGLLYTASCSSHIDPLLFQKIVFGAAKDARKNLRILARTSHPVDHPVSIYHPEGEYLKGLLCEADT